MDFWNSFWDIIWWFFWCFVFISYLFALFSIIGDLFRDRELSGVWKAVWLFFLFVVPFLTALIYLIARGSGMAERSANQARVSQAAAEDYIRSVATNSPTAEIAKAKEMLDNGTITQADFDQIKARVLTG